MYKRGIVQIQIEKPRLSIPASLIIDDPAPCINPFYYYRLQVDREGAERHEPRIPLAFLEQFADVCRLHDMRGKFSVLPYPAGLGSILEGWEGCDRAELAAWLELARTRIAPHFDITPEILTHTLALDLTMHALLPQSEHDWMAERTLDELTQYMGAALAILKEAGFQPTGITQPVAFDGARADYAQAVGAAICAIGGPPVTFFFIDGYFEGPPVPDHEVVLLDRERGTAVISILAYCNDYFWPTQHITNQRAEQVVDGLISADGRTGRLAELADAGAWLTLVCHWQTLYSDGSREGLKALDQAAGRLARAHGSRLLWLTLSEIARYRAASAGCTVDVHRSADGWMIDLDSPFDCPDFTLSLPAGELSDVRINRVVQQIDQGTATPLLADNRLETLLPSNAWRLDAQRLAMCFDLRRGRQSLALSASNLEVDRCFTCGSLPPFV
jgi:hypothetical protein